MKVFRPRPPSPALVVAIIALVVALGGTAYASFSLPKNSVGSKQLKSNAVTSKKIKNGAVNGDKIGSGAVTGDKIGNGAVTADKIGNGAVTASKINPAGLTVPKADTAGSAQAVSYAHVEVNGTLDAAHSKNVSSSTHGSQTGIYCLKTAVPVVTASVTLDSSTNYVGYGSAILSGEDPSNLIAAYCPSGMNVLVVMENQSNSNTDEAFWISFN